MLILISPAKSLNYDSELSYKDFTIPEFTGETKKLVNELKKFTVSDLEKLMNVSKKIAELNHQRFKDFSNDFNFNNSKQALLAFDGDVYKPIEIKKFTKKDFDFAQQHLRILSGLYGILRPLDLMQPYRLEMGTDFKNTIFEKDFKAKNLYQFWGDKISDKINSKKADYIINLASEEYFAAINSQKISAKIINIVFKEKKGDSYKIIGINAKKARGLMTNFIIRNQISNPSNLKDFDVENYCFNKEMSDVNNFVFTRS